jgi:hypothetical protein
MTLRVLDQFLKGKYESAMVELSIPTKLTKSARIFFSMIGLG